MNRRKNPHDRKIHPFTKKDDQVFFDHYGTMPVKDIIPMMEYPHPLDSMYGHAKRLGVSERRPLWKESEKRLLEKALELGMSYKVLAEATKLQISVRDMTEAGITQYLYRVRKRQSRLSSSVQNNG